MPTIRIATYNVHKCRGMDRRVRPERIAEVVAELNADVVALQEVVRIPHAAPEDDQAAFIAGRLGEYQLCFGENRQFRGGAYGNAILSRLPVALSRNYDLTWKGRERRGCLRADVQVPSGLRRSDPGATCLHLFNVHLGTAFLERRFQGRRLLSLDVLRAPELRGPRVVVGDFNEWTRGLATRLMAGEFESVDVRLHTGGRRTYPGMLPLLHLDHFYFDKHLRLIHFSLYRTRTSLLASDHLPMVAEFEVPASPGISR